MFRILFFILPLLPSIAYSQRPPSGARGSGITGYISGKVLDSISNEAIGYAAVGIIDYTTGKVINGGLTDDKGSFKITGLHQGTFTLQISFIGFSQKEIAGLVLSPYHPDLEYGNIFLSQESKLLDEVKVVGDVVFIEAKPDRLVYNAENDVTTRGGDAADVLRKVPFLAVDFDGNVSIRGSENVRILINGRPSGIFNAGVADALKMMPADQIKSVEVITSPSAKYDGEGTAGIINIITRKKNIEGLTGSANLTMGTRSNRGNANFSYGKGRLALNFSGGGYYGWPQEGSTSFRREEFGDAVPTLLTQDGFNTSSRLGFRTNAGMEYNINAYNTITSSLSYRGYNSMNYIDVLSSYSVNSDPLEVYRRTTDGNSGRGGWDWEGAYEKTFPDSEKKWSVAFEVDNDTDHAEYEYDQQFAIPITEASTVENNINEADNLEVNVQTDYVHPFGEHVILETGALATLRNIESGFRYDVFDPDAGTWNEDPLRSDIFYYEQNVVAGYVSATFNIDPKTTIIGGVRLEFTGIDGSFERFVSPFSNQYSKLLPNLTVSRKTGEYNQWRISYSQRIQRPRTRHVNPFIEYNDDRDISYGNPYLAPELVRQIELGTNIFLKENMLNLAVFGRQTEDLIESLLKINDEGISETTYENFGIKTAAGLNAYGSVNFGEKFSIRGGFDVNAWWVEGIFEGEDLTNSGFEYNARATVTWSITKTLRAEGFCNFRSPTYTVQGKLPNWVMSSFAIKQELFKKKFVVGINIFQPFTEKQTYEKEVSGDDFYQNNTTIRPSRSIGLNLGYRFGKLDFKERSGRKNGDQREESGSENPF
jgi:outer membrane receptor protein involved in Fe transport